MNRSFIELDSCQITKGGMRICGDVFLMDRVSESGRVVATLSDGMGSGVKANVLANLTAGMGQRFGLAGADSKKSAEVILNTLPVCLERKISYATFSMVDISIDGNVIMVEYDNPPALWIRNGKVLPIDRNEIVLDRKEAFRREVLQTSEFILHPEDRLVFCSDGVVQSGMGSAGYPLGWRNQGLIDFVEDLCAASPGISAGELALRIARRAKVNDGHQARDDISCVVAYARQPRKLLLATGPPFDSSRDTELAEEIRTYPGHKVLSGGTTASIVAREWGLDVEVNLKERTQGVPPSGTMAGVDLVTEGMLTLGRAAEMLENRQEISGEPRDGAEAIVSLLRDSDEVSFLVGTRINETHHDPSLPFELGIRRTLISRLRRSLESTYLKKTDVRYI